MIVCRVLRPPHPRGLRESLRALSGSQVSIALSILRRQAAYLLTSYADAARTIPPRRKSRSERAAEQVGHADRQPALTLAD
jgi:hypothetical protein